MKLDRDSRKYEILTSAIDIFIRNAQPITSIGLSKVIENVSSATLRNELNSLEAMGYLRQLHTSGGRVPTSEGYKVYVDGITLDRDISMEEIRKVGRDYEKSGINLLSTLTTLARGLSNMTNCPTVLLQGGLDNLSIINIQIVPLILKDALLLVETDCGIIDESIPLSTEVSRQSCIEASEYMTLQFKGKTIKYMFDNINEVILRAGGQVMQFKSIIDIVIDALVKVTQKDINISQENIGKLYTNLTQEEQKRLTTMNNWLDDSDKVAGIISSNVGDSINISMGDELSEELEGGMMMTTPIVINGVSIASLALLAPQRVDYASLAAAMKFISSQLQKSDKGGNT